MHFLIVTQYYWPEDFRINDLVQGLIDRGHKITVLTGIPNYPHGKFFSGYSLFSLGEEYSKNVRIIRVPLFPRGNGRAWRLILNYLSFMVSATFFGPFYCRENYDIILGYAPSPITVAIPAILLRAIKKAPFMFWIQDLWPESLQVASKLFGPHSLAFVRKVVDFIYRRCDKILIQSPGFRSHVEQAGINKDNILLFPNWAEELYQPKAKSAKFAKEAHLPDGLKVLFAGNIGMAQDFETIISAAKILKSHSDIHFVILGDGRHKGWVQKEIRSSGLEKTVHLLGRKSVESMPDYFANVDVLLATLKNDPIFLRTIPSKLQTYLACKKPVIVGIGGVAADIIRESKAGLSTTPGDPQDLADAILEINKLSEFERQKLGDNGYEYYLKNYERNMLIDRLEGWAKSLKEGNP
jgi:glycosyltransferase involved in cell wall biosynthesis